MLAMPISKWPTEERPREKLLAYGATALSDAELLAIFLRSGVPGKTAVDLARELLRNFGSLRKLFNSSPEQFCQLPGLGAAKYAQLQAALEIGRRHLKETLVRQNLLANPKETKNYLTARLRNYQHEVFACLFLDNHHRIISFDELFHGTVNATSVYPREIVKRALGHNAAAVIFAHNHPSGIAEPSLADKLITQQLIKTLQIIDVRVLDHIIIGEGQVTSFAEKGIL